MYAFSLSFLVLLSSIWFRQLPNILLHLSQFRMRLPRIIGFRRKSFLSSTRSLASILIPIFNLNWRRLTLIIKYIQENHLMHLWFFIKTCNSLTLRIFKRTALNFWYIFWIGCMRSLKIYMFQMKRKKKLKLKMDSGMKLEKKIRKSRLEIKIYLTRSKKV